MTTEATVNDNGYQIDETFAGKLVSDPKIHFGLSRLWIPGYFSLKVSTFGTKDNLKTSYHLDLREGDTSKTQNNHMYGYFGFPLATTERSDSWGYDGYGLITDLPTEILQAIEDVVGIQLTTLKAS